MSALRRRRHTYWPSPEPWTLDLWRLADQAPRLYVHGAKRRSCGPPVSRAWRAACECPAAGRTLTLGCHSTPRCSAVHGEWPPAHLPTYPPTHLPNVRPVRSTGVELVGGRCRLALGRLVCHVDSSLHVPPTGDQLGGGLTAVYFRSMRVRSTRGTCHAASCVSNNSPPSRVHGGDIASQNPHLLNRPA